jgi:protein arginine kinase
MLLRSAANTRRRTASDGGAADIAVSCRVRLARNLRGVRFPDWADEKERCRVFDLLSPWLMKEAGLFHATIAAVGSLDEITRAMLCERHLISREMAERGPGAGVVVGADERLAVMINEEDHLRIQAIMPGMELARAWASANAMDLRLEEQFEFAFHNRLGYLTACPSNVGTGMRASVMVHLLGLRLSNDLDAVLRALERLRLTVRGVNGEGSEAAGHMFQISNQETLGSDETALMDNLLDVVGDVVHQERNARLRLQRDSPAVLLDCVARALAIIQSARIMETEEALDYLSALRLGVSMGLVRRLTIAHVDALALHVQPGHLQRRMGVALEPARRDVMRANLMREMLRPVVLRGMKETI